MNVLQPVIEYFRSSRAEFKKVAWPTRQDTIRYSMLVVAISVIVAAFFFLLDSGLSKAVEALVSRNTPSAQTAPAAPPTPAPPNSENINLNPVQVQATNPNGQPATDLKVTPVPVK